MTRVKPVREVTFRGPTFWLASLWVAAVAMGCGPTVGDACTTNDDCGDGLCVNEPWAPGGYCSTGCRVTDEEGCPAGSTCVADALGLGAPACLLTCEASRDCRSGYGCREVSAPAVSVCLGADAL